MEAGLAIVLLAIALDRLSQAFANRGSNLTARGGASLPVRHAHLMLAATVLVGTTLLSFVVPGFAKVPASFTLSTAPYWKAGVDWITQNYFDAIEAFRVGLLMYVLNPVRAFLEGFPWPGAVLLLGLAGLRLGGWRLAALVATLTLFCAATGLWQKTMATVYLCGVSALLSMLI